MNRTGWPMWERYAARAEVASLVGDMLTLEGLVVLVWSEAMDSRGSAGVA